MEQWNNFHKAVNTDFPNVDKSLVQNATEYGEQNLNDRQFPLETPMEIEYSPTTNMEMKIKYLKAQGIDAKRVLTESEPYEVKISETNLFARVPVSLEILKNLQDDPEVKWVGPAQGFPYEKETI